MAVKNQKITDDYALYEGDCCEVIPDLPDDSVGFSVFSPPFADLYSYTDKTEDMSNVKSYQDFFDHFEFLVKELMRIMVPGRSVAVHCMDLPLYKRDGEEIGMRDFSGDLIRCFQDHGFIFHSRHCIWKDPLLMAVRTKAIGLAHKQIVKDSAMCRTGLPDYLLTMRKPGENPNPIEHPKGLTQYCGSRSIPRDLDKWIDSDEPRTNKRSHWRQPRVLPFREARDDDDTKHICPLQLDVIERCLTLWSNTGDTILTPFMGVGSEAYVAVEMKRKAIGIELKESYYRQAVRNVKQAKKGKRKMGFDFDEL
jgi:DNA modification methylase